MNIDTIREYAQNYLAFEPIEGMDGMGMGMEGMEGPPPPPRLLPSWNINEVEDVNNKLVFEDVVCVNRLNPLPVLNCYKTYVVKVNNQKVRVDFSANQLISVSMW